eukprot:CAMPEP_0198222830 /NCGR_PEP_ID=MMETSP1445-20131203/89914_1 /TAXON_ID=36898 /ORGANISM="Pyramimonas sp., Strain CCMP2087" /LENGTH=70 /DNA_ID=CAMNT_0043901483 /DNA_START=169 /DNA_END=381 /DNA_ORIENTATION=-
MLALIHGELRGRSFLRGEVVDAGRRLGLTQRAGQRLVLAPVLHDAGSDVGQHDWLLLCWSPTAVCLSSGA